MQALISTMDQMLFLFLCMLIGFLLNRKKVIGPNSDVVMSRLENYVFVPALIIHTFRQYCTKQYLSENITALLYCVAVIGISCVVAFALAPKLAQDKKLEGIFRYSLAVTNFGFMGNSLVQGLLGDEALFRYLIFTIPGNLFICTIGTVWLTSGKEKFSGKMLLNPLFISMLVGIALGLTKLPLPSFMEKTLSGCAACYSPLAMVLTGFVIGKYDLKKLMTKTNVYILTLIRVVLMPLAFLGLCTLAHVPDDMKTMIVFFTAMPLGLYTIIIPAAYGGDDHPGAAMAVISNLIGIVTVPFIISLVI